MSITREFLPFFYSLRAYIRFRGYRLFTHFEVVKSTLVDALYKKRGRYVRPFLHVGTVGLIFFTIIIGPKVISYADQGEELQTESGVLNGGGYSTSFYTQQAEEVRQFRGGEVLLHSVVEGETLSSIAERYGLQVNTLLWENDLTEKSKLQPGQELRILPVDGIRHKVARGETIYSIGKKYGLEGSEVQVLVDYPFNDFLNDETFELATGQFLVVPNGVRVAVSSTGIRQTTTARLTPDAGSVTAFGSFVWPAAGRITQSYSFYHKAIDIANGSGGPIVAADSGVVTQAGWLDGFGYGNRIMVDHGNGSQTLYAHLSVIQVQPGQRVNRGDVIGQMGNTGRSTGTHLHFEIRQGGVLLNPQSSLR
ncbi:MAG: peptidoglycan DD-metalloendopeptidase family protein [Candidatus Pacebacteria bacterium]|nr:peptidoglycan DD-metalloendopeptidase family protein [Candidatus Paceibacterota bacterium]